MKHLLYLDIDGVLANDESYDKHIETKWGRIYPFDDENVKLFNKLLNEYDIQYVISSDWRRHYSLDQLCEIFRWNGVTQMPIGITVVAEPIKFREHLDSIRVREIKHNILGHQVDGVWFALDDLNLKDLNEGKNVHFIMSDPLEGLKGEGVMERIIILLNSKNNEEQ
jgi:hypothetical protein